MLKKSLAKRIVAIAQKFAAIFDVDTAMETVQKIVHRHQGWDAENHIFDNDLDAELKDYQELAQASKLLCERMESCAFLVKHLQKCYPQLHFSIGLNSTMGVSDDEDREHTLFIAQHITHIVNNEETPLGVNPDFSRLVHLDNNALQEYADIFVHEWIMQCFPNTEFHAHHM